MKLLTTNSKIDKSMKAFPEYEASILQMLPRKGICENYKECIKNCLAFKGLAKVYPSITKSRKAKTDFFLTQHSAFMKQLVKEISNQVKRAHKKGKIPCVRLNGFSDIDWVKQEFDFTGRNIFNTFPNVIFWDYTADFNKVLENRSPNYYLTFSYKGNNLADCAKLHLTNKANVAVIDTPKNRETFKHTGQVPVEGDTHDFRFLDGDLSIVWLSEKK